MPRPRAPAGVTSGPASARARSLTSPDVDKAAPVGAGHRPRRRPAQQLGDGAVRGVSGRPRGAGADPTFRPVSGTSPAATDAPEEHPRERAPCTGTPTTAARRRRRADGADGAPGTLLGRGAGRRYRPGGAGAPGPSLRESCGLPARARLDPDVVPARGLMGRRPAGSLACLVRTRPALAGGDAARVLRPRGPGGRPGHALHRAVRVRAQRRAGPAAAGRRRRAGAPSAGRAAVARRGRAPADAGIRRGGPTARRRPAPGRPRPSGSPRTRPASGSASPAPRRPGGWSTRTPTSRGNHAVAGPVRRPGRGRLGAPGPRPGRDHPRRLRLAARRRHAWSAGSCPAERAWLSRAGRPAGPARRRLGRARLRRRRAHHARGRGGRRARRGRPAAARLRRGRRRRRRVPEPRARRWPAVLVTWHQHDRMSVQQVRGAAMEAAVQRTMNAAVADLLRTVGFEVEPFGSSGCWMVTPGPQ